jgi:hypothetical protein
VCEFENRKELFLPKLARCKSERIIHQSTNDAHCDTSLAAKCGSSYHHLGLVRGALIESRKAHGLGSSQIIGLDHLALRVPDMRRRLLLSAATILCCGYSSLAYSQHTLTGSPTIAPQLFLAQSSGPEQFDAPDEPASAKLSPFDLFGPEEKQVNTQDQLLSQPKQPVAEGSIPVGHHNLPSATANAIGGQIQPAYFPPIDYASHQRRTPNLIANFMTQEWCADGLWSNYESERIAQCAKQAQRIAGRHHHCGQCGPSGCVQQPAPAYAAQHRHFGSGRHFQRGGLNALNQLQPVRFSAPVRAKLWLRPTQSKHY